MKKIGQITLVAVALCLFGLVYFAPKTNAYSAAEYVATSKLSVGTVATLSPGDAVAAASTSSQSYVGVVVSSTSTGATVATEGRVMTYVSDEDGSIRKGERIGVSALAGVATVWQSGRQLIGIAGATPSDWKTTHTSSGKAVHIARIPVDLLPANSNPGAVASNGLENTMQQLANRLTGKTVAFWRIIAAFIIGIGGLLVAFGLMFSSTRGSFLSMGRNPLASPTIIRSMWHVIGISVVVLLLAIVIAYLVMWVGA